MKTDREFDELLRQKISETLEEPIDESIDADDLMFDLGMRYLRMVAAEKKKSGGKKRDPLSLWVEGAPSKKELVDYVDSVTKENSRDYIFYRLQCDSEGVLRSYIAEGEILPVATTSFGGIGVFAIHEMGRFYRHVLLEKRYPHHGAVAFGHHGKTLFEVFKYLGVQDIGYNQPKSLLYPTENPFA